MAQVWRDARTVNVIAAAALHKSRWGEGAGGAAGGMGCCWLALPGQRGSHARSQAVLAAPLPAAAHAIRIPLSALPLQPGHAGRPQVLPGPGRSGGQGRWWVHHTLVEGQWCSALRLSAGWAGVAGQQPSLYISHNAFRGCAKLASAAAPSHPPSCTPCIAALRPKRRQRRRGRRRGWQGGSEWAEP